VGQHGLIGVGEKPNCHQLIAMRLEAFILVLRSSKSGSSQPIAKCFENDLSLSSFPTQVEVSEEDEDKVEAGKV
jgi:hypothetical protein